MYRVMAALWQRGGQRLGDLSEMTTVEISTLSRLVGGLQLRSPQLMEGQPTEAGPGPRRDPASGSFLAPAKSLWCENVRKVKEFGRHFK